MPGGPQIFREPLDQHRSVFITLTKTQNIVLKRRLEYLFPHSKQSMSNYVRELILGDLRNWLKQTETLKNKEMSKISKEGNQ